MSQLANKMERDILSKNIEQNDDIMNVIGKSDLRASHLDLESKMLSSYRSKLHAKEAYLEEEKADVVQRAAKFCSAFK